MADGNSGKRRGQAGEGDGGEPVRRMEMSIGYEKTAKERDAAFLAAVTGRLSIKSSHNSVRRPMRRNLK